MPSPRPPRRPAAKAAARRPGVAAAGTPATPKSASAKKPMTPAVKSTQSAAAKKTATKSTTKTAPAKTAVKKSSGSKAPAKTAAAKAPAKTAAAKAPAKTAARKTVKPAPKATGRATAASGGEPVVAAKPVVPVGGHLSESELREIESELHAQRRQLLRSRDGINATLASDREGMSTSGDVADVSGDMATMESATLLADHTTRQLAEIEGALRRLRSNPQGFGICEKSGEPIPFGRLIVVPTARTVRRLAGA